MKCILIIRRCISINYLHSFLRPVTAHRVGAVFPLTVVIFHSGKKKPNTKKPYPHPIKEGITRGL